MQIDPIKFALVMAACHAIVRAVKSDGFSSQAALLGLPPVPKSALPWIALAASFAISCGEAVAAGHDWQAALLSGIVGLLAGGSAVAVQETFAQASPKVIGKSAAKIIFGKVAK